MYSVNVFDVLEFPSRTNKGFSITSVVNFPQENPQNTKSFYNRHNVNTVPGSFLAIGDFSMPKLWWTKK